jgi:stalled ribosome alternative rescue factor ArfA
MAEVAFEDKKASDKKIQIVEPPQKSVVPLKSPSNVVYRLLKQNDRTQRTDTPLYPPYKRFPNIDIIVWEDATREIRWLPGEQSIFVDEQEKNGRKIPENILNNPNNRFEIIDGEIRVRPHEKTKILFLDMCNRNADSKHSTGTIQPLFRKYTEKQRVEDLGIKQRKQKEAINKSFEASPDLVYFHARHLNIPLMDSVTGASREIDALITDYRQMAMDFPVEFLKVFDDENLTAKFNK